MKTVSPNTQTKRHSSGVEIITSNYVELVEGVNYFTREQKTWRGQKWISFNAQIGDTFSSCISFEQLESKVRNFDFTPKNESLTAQAIEEFGTNA